MAQQGVVGLGLRAKGLAVVAVLVLILGFVVVDDGLRLNTLRSMSADFVSTTFEQSSFRPNGSSSGRFALACVLRGLGPGAEDQGLGMHAQLVHVDRLSAAASRSADVELVVVQSGELLDSELQRLQDILRASGSQPALRVEAGQEMRALWGFGDAFEGVYYVRLGYSAALVVERLPELFAGMKDGEARFASVLGAMPTTSPTPKPTTAPSVTPTAFPTMSPTIGVAPTVAPTAKKEGKGKGKDSKEKGKGKDKDSGKNNASVAPTVAPTAKKEGKGKGKDSKEKGKGKDKDSGKNNAGGRGGQGTNDRRDLHWAKVSELNPHVDITKLEYITRVAALHDGDPRLRPLRFLALKRPDARLWTADLERIRAREATERFGPTSMEHCTSYITRGFLGVQLRGGDHGGVRGGGQGSVQGGKAATTARIDDEANLESSSESAVVPDFLGQVPAPLPLEAEELLRMGQGAQRMVVHASADGEGSPPSALGVRAMDAASGPEAKASRDCAMELRVRAMAERARSKVVEAHVPADPSARGAGERQPPGASSSQDPKAKGDLSNMVFALKTHKMSERINRTLHSWAFDLAGRGAPVLAVVQGMPGSEVYKNISQEAARSEDGFHAVLVDQLELILHVLPREAVERAIEWCTTYHASKVLCQYNPKTGEAVFNDSMANMHTLTWLWTMVSTLATVAHAMHEFPDMEYLWMTDYDVTYTGRISTLATRTAHDDSDLLGLSMAGGDATNIVENHARHGRDHKDFWREYGMLYNSDLAQMRYTFSSSLRLSRRYMQWLLEASFSLENWSIDEIVFGDVCTRRDSCKFTPLQIFDLGSTKTYNARPLNNYKILIDEDSNADHVPKLHHKIAAEAVDPIERYLFLREDAEKHN